MPNALHMYLHIYICIDLYIYIYLHVYTCTYIHIHTQDGFGHRTSKIIYRTIRAGELPTSLSFPVAGRI